MSGIKMVQLFKFLRTNKTTPLTDGNFQCLYKFSNQAWHQFIDLKSKPIWKMLKTVSSFILSICVISCSKSQTSYDINRDVVY